MKDLADIQKSFQDALLENKSDFTNLVVHTKAPSTKQRVHIYIDGYFARLYEALADNYPQLYKHLGETKFFKLAKIYVKHYPSQSYSIRWFGNKLSYLIQQESHYKNRQNWAELATFDWAVGETFDAPDANVISSTTLREIPVEKWPRMKFKFHPSVRQHYFSYNTAKAWQNIADDQKTYFRKLGTPQSILFWRKDLVTLYRPLNHLEDVALQLMTNNNNFATLCSKISELVDPNEAAMQSATILMQWIEEGLITQISTR